MPTKLTPSKKVYHVESDPNRGPMTMIRLRFHPTRAYLVGQCVDRLLALWDLNGETKKIKKGEYVLASRVCPHELGWIRGIDIHPSGNWIATGGSDRRLKLWAWNEAEPDTTPTADVAAHAGWVEAVAFSPDGQTLATAGADRLVKLWKAATLEPVFTLEGHTSYVRDLVWLPDGKTLISGDEHGKVLLWDASSGKLNRSIDFGGANDQQGQNPRVSGVHRIAVSHDARWLAVAGSEKSNVYELSTDMPVATEKADMQAAFHPSSDVLALGESEVTVWNIDAGKLKPAPADNKGNRKIAALPGKQLGKIKRGEYSQGLCFSPDGKVLACGKSDGNVELWELV
jgi:WD40 repeat protein